MGNNTGHVVVVVFAVAVTAVAARSHHDLSSLANNTHTHTPSCTSGARAPLPVGSNFSN